MLQKLFLFFMLMIAFPCLLFSQKKGYDKKIKDKNTNSLSVQKMDTAQNKISIDSTLIMLNQIDKNIKKMVAPNTALIIYK